MQRVLLFSLLAVALLTVLGVAAIVNNRPGAAVSGTSPAGPGAGVTTAATIGEERLPCGHRLLDAAKEGEHIWAECVRSHTWEYGERGWFDSRAFSDSQSSLPPPVMPSSEDLLPCGHRFQRSRKDGDQLSGECTQGHAWKKVAGRWVKG